MIIPGFVISILTFPGVIVHELAHQICCRLCRIPVFEVKYFQAKNPCGFVRHEQTDNPWKNLVVCLGPFFFNTILGMIITLPAYHVVRGGFRGMRGHEGEAAVMILLYWLGVSVLMHSFPSTGDARVLVECVLKNKKVNALAKIVTAPFIGLIYLGAAGSFFWLDLIYGLAMSAVLPNLLFRVIFPELLVFSI